MGKNWSEAAAQLVDWLHCPRCEAVLGAAGWCSRCGADLTGPIGAELVTASTAAAEALARRETIMGRIPTVWPATHTAVPVTGAAMSASAANAAVRLPAGPSVSTVDRHVPVPAEAQSVAAAASGSQISVQSVLAVAGAGLLAVAALVFTFLNPELTSFATRTTIIAVITVAFVAGAWLFARRGLQFSAEAVGALAAVFAALDVWAFSQTAPDGVSVFVYAALGLFVGSAVFLGLGARRRIRTWLWAAVVGFALTPGFLGAAGGGEWAPVLGSLFVAIVVLVLHRVLAALEPGFGALLRTERTTATTLQIVAVVVAVVQLLLLWFGLPDLGPGRILGVATILLTLSAVATIGSWNGLKRFWSFVAGIFAVAAIGLLPFALRLTDEVWYLALVPLATGMALVAVSALRPAVAARRDSLQQGARTLALLSAVPTVFVAVQLLFWQLSPIRLIAVFGDIESVGSDLLPRDAGLAVILGVAAVSLTSGAQSWVLRRADAAGRFADRGAQGPLPHVVEKARPASIDRGARSQALWMGVLTLLTITGWSGFERGVQSAIGLALAAGLSLLLVGARSWAGRRPEASVGVGALTETAVRRPLIIGAHLLLGLAALIGWLQQHTMVGVGAATVLVLGVVALAMPARWNPLYLGIGYGYALIVFATALTRADVEGIAVLCLTTTLALVVALGVTLARWLSPRSWYAILIVTAVPFLLGIAAVLMVRSGWTALSTGIAFALAVTLMVTRRPGMTLLLRAASAALLVPALSVVVVCLGAWLFESSGSPIVLPIVAAIVACTAPTAGLIAAALRRRGIPARESDAARLWIEISAIVTGVLAVLLALVRAAAGLQTTFLVLVILGAGAAATAFTTRRRRAWWAAAASWTGALWCVWALQGVDVLEPYVLPPALTAVLVGALIVARGAESSRSFATALFATGLAVAVIPSLLALALSGTTSEFDGTGQSVLVVPWRTYGLIFASVILVLLGAFVMRAQASARLRPLRVLRRPTLVVATIAAGAGAVQAVRWGLAVDPLSFVTPTILMLQVLGFSVIAAVLAAASGAVFARRLAAISGAARLALSNDAVSEGAGAGRAAASPETDSTSTAPSRWRYAAATAFLVVGPITAIRFDAFSIGTLMVLTLALLTFMLVIVALARGRAVSLPPVWFIFGLAWCTAVAGWSPRELRVEAFSLPLGLALLGAGIIALRPVRGVADGAPDGQAMPRATVTSWPNGFVGSWRVLAPGIIVTFLPSVLATGTDPQTWRAILVMSFALAAILIGSVKRLAAPFVLGLAVLPIEVIVVFTVQIGQTINPLLWWITLAAVGAVLLVIAITSERKGTGVDGGFTARMRDLG